MSYGAELERAQASYGNIAERLATRLHDRFALVETAINASDLSARLKTAQNAAQLQRQVTALAADVKLRNVALYDLRTQQWIFSTPSPTPQDGTLAILDREQAAAQLTSASLAGNDSIVVRVPVVVSGNLRYTLSGTFPAQDIRRIVGEVIVPPGTVLEVLDSEQRIVARNVDPGKYVGTNAPSDLQVALKTSREGFFRSTTASGEETPTVFYRLNPPGWTVVIYLPKTSVTLRSVIPTFGATAFGVTLVGAALLLTWSTAQQVARGFAALNAAAAALARAEVISLTPVGFTEGDSFQEELLKTSRQLHDFHSNLLSQKQEMSEFALAAAHDLRTPLFSLAGYADVLASRHSEELGPEGKVRLGRMRAAIAQLGMLLDGMFSLSRLAAASHEAVVLNTIMDRCLALMHADIVMAGAQVNVMVPMLQVRCNPNALVQVLMNLISNAIKYRSDERGLYIHVAAERVDQVVEVVVSDNGVGIPRDQREEVFVMYKRLRPDKAHGSGIGLAICRRVIRQHGGEIWLEDSGGEGTVVKFTLPYHS